MGEIVIYEVERGLKSSGPGEPPTRAPPAAHGATSSGQAMWVLRERLLKNYFGPSSTQVFEHLHALK